MVGGESWRSQGHQDWRARELRVCSGGGKGKMVLSFVLLVEREEFEPLGSRRVEVPMQVGLVRLGGRLGRVLFLVGLLPRREMIPIGML